MGPTLNVEILVPTALEQYLKSVGQAVPLPVRGVALVDTGATISAVDDSVVKALNLSPIGLTKTGTAVGPAQQYLYPARFALLDLGSGYEFSRVLGANLSGTGYIALIGRDVLTQILMVYNGPLGIVTFGV